MLGFRTIYYIFRPMKLDKSFWMAYSRLPDEEKQQVDEMLQLAAQEDISEK